MTTICVIGAGIVGLAVARELAIRRPGIDVQILEKEPGVARHQTGHNSGVVHAGLYYKPGSAKAVLCRRGARMLEEFCHEHGVEFDRRGKTVVALNEEELGPLREIQRRARENGVPGVTWLDRAQLRDREPHVSGVAALWSPATAIVDYVAVTEALAKDAVERGAQLHLSSPVTGLRRDGAAVIVEAGGRTIAADLVISCTGLQSDDIVELAGVDPNPKIVPFRGEYFTLAPRAKHLVRGLVYPVPDPRYPFLGVHFTPDLRGEVHVGPNALLALAREGYKRSDVSGADLRAILGWPGFWRMAKTHWATGARELAASLSIRLAARAARRYLPELGPDDLTRAGAGVRAQAVDRSGDLVDDFRISSAPGLVLVRNAPSPAATASLAIAERICAIALDGEQP